MIAEIIPRTRLARHLHRFDYMIPPHITVSVGDVVCIPFRSSRILGIVTRVKKHSSVKNLKTISEKLPSFSLSPEYIDLIIWFAKEYYISEAFALKTFIPDIPKSSKKTKNSHARTTKKTNIFLKSSRIPLIQKSVHQISINTHPTLVRYTLPFEKEALYHGFLQKNTGTTILITPTIQQAEFLAAVLQPLNPIILHHHLSVSEQWARFVEARTRENALIIGTKMALFAYNSMVTTIIIDDCDSPHHKNYDQNPRFLVHDVAFFLSKKLKHLIFTSRSPRVTTRYNVKNFVDIATIPNHTIHVIDMATNQKDSPYISYELMRMLENGKKIFIFLNRKGDTKYTVCAECRMLYPFNSIIRCNNCSSMKLYAAGFGTQKILKVLKEKFPEKKIHTLDTENQAIPDESDIVIGTEFAFDKIDLARFDLIASIGTDILLTRTEWRGSERAFQLLTFLFSQKPDILVQTYAPDNKVLQWARSFDYESFFQEELKIRKAFHYPPFGHLYKVIHKTSHKADILKKPPSADSLSSADVIDIDPDVIL